MNRMNFTISELLPRDGRRVDLNGLVDDVIRDMSVLGRKCCESDVLEHLKNLHSRQYIFMFQDDTVALTRYGEVSTWP